MCDYNEDSIIKDSMNAVLKSIKKTKLIAFTLCFLLVAILLFGGFIISKSVKDVSFSVKEVSLQVESGLQDMQKQIDQGNGDRISLKHDAFAVVDNTEITFENGLDPEEIEKILDSHKYSEKTNIDGNLSDQKANSQKFNYIWGVEQGFDTVNTFDQDFKERLTHTEKQHLYQVDWQYFSQRSVPKIGNIICVPSSASILLKSMGYNVNATDLVKFFQKNEKIKKFAKDHFGKWIDEFIRDKKLYQITGVFTYGLNLYLDTYFEDFPYKLDYDYWSLDKITEYLESYGLMSATYFPEYVRYGTRTGGHMITITKAYKDYEGNVNAFGINDPFGNPNVSYKGARGLDGKNVIIPKEEMKTVMKSYHDDHHKGQKDLYRVLYFRDKG